MYLKKYILIVHSLSVHCKLFSSFCDNLGPQLCLTQFRNTASNLRFADIQSQLFQVCHRLYSSLEHHQVEALRKIVDAGGIGIVAWVNGCDCRLYQWPIDGFGPGKSLKWCDHGGK